MLTLFLWSYLKTQVHWFPRHISELDLIANRTLDAGTDLEADHPGFHDVEYRQRRANLAKQALEYRMHHEIPQTNYTKEEVETWGLVWDTMEGLWDKVSHDCLTSVDYEWLMLKDMSWKSPDLTLYLLWLLVTMV